MGYIQDKVDDALFEAKLKQLRDGEMPNGVYVDTVASLVRIVTSEVVNQTMIEHEAYLLSNGIDEEQEREDLDETLRVNVFRALRDSVESWKRSIEG